MLVSTPQHTRTQTQQNVFDDWMDIALPSSELELQAQISTCSYLPHQSPGISTPRCSAESIQQYPKTSTYVCAPFLSSEPASSPSAPVEIPMDTLLKLKNESNSRRNFAFKQAERMFTYDERLTSNCQGKRGKKPLDKKRLEVIRKNTLKLWPLENKEDEVGAWHDCRRAIDEGGWQLNHRLRLQNKTFN